MCVDWFWFSVVFICRLSINSFSFAHLEARIVVRSRFLRKSHLFSQFISWIRSEPAVFAFLRFIIDSILQNKPSLLHLILEGSYGQSLFSLIVFRCCLARRYEISVHFPTVFRCLCNRLTKWTYIRSFLPHISYVNLLKPTGHVMHQQFNIQQLDALPTLYLCVLYLSENKQRLVPLTA